MINSSAYDRFKELRQEYYIAGRTLLINRLFGSAGINFGYAIELSLKFLLVFKGETKGLMNHDIEKYYDRAIQNNYIASLNISTDFLRFTNERLNARYPSTIQHNLNEHKKESRGYVFSIDMLHCYDDFILQLDDAITEAVGDPRSSIGFRCCRDLLSAKGRIFFHCNDHAFQRIEIYIESLNKYRDDGDGLDKLVNVISNKDELWNYKALIAFRPWGPKQHWSPASEFSFAKFKGDKINMKAAQWSANNAGIDMYLSSMNMTLPAGKWETSIHTKTVIKPPKHES